MLVCFVFPALKTFYLLFSMSRQWLFLEGNLSPQDTYNIYRQDFFEIGFLIAHTGWLPTHLVAEAGLELTQ